MLLDRLSGLTVEHDPTLRPSARARAISGAFARAGARSSLRPRAPAALSFKLGAAAAIATAVALGVALRPAATPSGSAAVADNTATAVPAARKDRVLTGEVLVDGHGLAVGGALPSDQNVLAVSGAELQLAHARLAMKAGTRVRWNASTHAVTLVGGKVTVDVDPAPHLPFSVQTARFRVEVLGTRFTVDDDGVSVERGTVRVTTNDGSVIGLALTAGQSFRLPSPPAVTAPAAAIAGDAAEQAAASADETAAKPTGPDADSQARALLQRARRQLAERDGKAAWRSLRDALALHPSLGLREQAQLLTADSYVVMGDVQRAIGEYLSVANHFAPRVGAQNALFTAARLQSERGHDRPAFALFSQYIARYPQGALVQDARRRKEALRPASPQSSAQGASDLHR
jgi:TolA-binding protein